MDEFGPRPCTALKHNAMSNNRFEVVVEGIDDAALVAAIDNAVRGALRELSLPGSWRVVVKPSAQPAKAEGRWEFTVYGLDVRHARSIAVPAGLLPNLIPQRLRESLDRPGGRGDGEAARGTHDLARAV